MNDKEKADCLIELHKEQMNHYRQTREIEWRVNLALWTIIVLAGYYLNTKIHFENIWSIIGYLLIALVIVLCHIYLWLKPISKSEIIDRDYILEYRRKVEELSEQTIKISEGKIIGEKWISFESSITILLLSIVGILFGISC